MTKQKKFAGWPRKFQNGGRAGYRTDERGKYNPARGYVWFDLTTDNPYGHTLDENQWTRVYLDVDDYRKAVEAFLRDEKCEFVGTGGVNELDGVYEVYCDKDFFVTTELSFGI